MIARSLVVVCLGEALVDILPLDTNQTLQKADVLRRVAGGAPANVAVGLVRLGVEAAFLGKVGADPFGYFLAETLQAEGVDISHMRFSSAANTGLAFAWVDNVQTGEARYLFYRQPSADRLLEVSDIDQFWLSQVRALQFGSLLLAYEPARTACLTAIRAAYTAGVPCIYDVNLRLPAWPSAEAARIGMLEPLEYSLIVKLNRHELKFLTGESDLAAGVAQLWREGQRLIIVTLDNEGCYYKTKAGEGIVAPVSVKVVDTVGCGDAFVAALIAQILDYEDKDEGSLNFDFENLELIAKVCEYANVAGALTATKAGAIPALPTRAEINRFLANK